MNKYQVDVPEGTSGDWRVKRFFVTKEEAQFSALRAMCSSGGRGVVPSGNYTQLWCQAEVVMSDTPDEIRDHLGFIRAARGRVLIHGLGLGMCLNAVLSKDNVEHALVIEKSQEVIRLVADHYIQKFGTNRLEIRQDDAYTWQPEKGQKWDVVWHDIWTQLKVTNLPLIHKLHRRFGRRCDWQGSWGRAFLERYHKRK